MITDFQQKLALFQEEDTVSNDEFEEAAPTTMLGDDIFLLDNVILMMDELVSQAGKAWNDRHTISDNLTPPVHQHQHQPRLLWDPRLTHGIPVFEEGYD